MKYRPMSEDDKALLKDIKVGFTDQRVSPEHKEMLQVAISDNFLNEYTAKYVRRVDK